MYREIISAPDLLALIASPERPKISLKTLIIVAHPDDESVGCGGLLPRLTDVTVLHVTDGASRNPVDARRRGFTHWADYARVRRQELLRAAEIAGIAPPALRSLGVPDRGAALRLAQLTRVVLGFIAGADVVLTHAFEGGHPDHDAVAFAVAAAHSRMRGRAPVLIEMPLYGPAVDRRPFGDRSGGEVRLRLTREERARKAKMLAVFTTQHESLAAFGARDEIYRLAPAYDFTQPLAHIAYEHESCGITGGQFAQLARAARGELGFSPG